jgi:pimeloyl-ACP methyl ester carboxylesterase
LFVHGLTGDRLSTWTHSNHFFWPQGALAQDIPGAVVATFGYDADVVALPHMASSNVLRNHGQSLADSIKALLVETQEAHASLLPVYICAHSLGGLVAESAYLQARDRSELHTVYQQIHGMVFFGTPHGGSGVATMGTVVSRLVNCVRSSNTQLLEDLKRNAGKLCDLANDFHTEVKERSQEKPMRLHYFFEAKRVLVVGKIVEEYSATVPGYPRGSIDADHMEMTKFDSAKSSDYAQKVIVVMKEMIARDKADPALTGES